ncbi:MAG: hypothetical protein A2X64_08595 [Ignavibacteria bacterium GWF2_33_9]|nr:MAG: hypothetical protein A2X64_08595 [Ignavibacteria bacterium GWF2_33_9]
MQESKLRIAFLWHNHQPYYEKEGEFILPWVRLHSVKDYLDLPLLLHEFQKIKQTLNIVPSVILQIEKYVSGEMQDTIQRLTKIPAKNLSPKDKELILNLFFICNEHNLINPLPRFRELLHKSREHDIHVFDDQDWLDLQVLYNLAWLGEYTKQTAFAKRLIEKGRKFSETEKLLLLDLHTKIMSEILPLYKQLRDLGQVEISTTPFFHPILPLLINSDSAKEANPANHEINPKFAYPEDALRQINMALQVFKKEFNESPHGFWASEGSLSNETLEMLAERGLEWTATDEEVLFASTHTKSHLEKYFPRKFKRNGKEITVFFRDHILSDKIGFQYSTWKPFDAAANFVHSLLDIRREIVSFYGENALQSAVVPIILDGENCWEFYPNNGFEFLRELYSQLSENNLLNCVLFSDLVHDGSNNFQKELNSIRAGSWIDANFNIWAGHKDDIAAWNILSSTRKLFEDKKESFKKDLQDRILYKFMIAEGSDWFWWYGPEHHAPNKQDFDILFRWHIKEIYELMGEKVPNEVYIPIGEVEQNFALPTGKIDGSRDVSAQGESGFFEFSQNFSTMHQAAKPSVRVYFGNDHKHFYLQVVNLFENSSKNVFAIDFGNKYFEISAKNEKFVKYSFELNDLQIISVSFKLINFAEQVDFRKDFEYKIV